jgi:hypothetical protein
MPKQEKKLSEEVQLYIVKQLACYRSPQQVADDVKEEFDVDVSRQQVRTYNPDQCEGVAEKWKKIFDETRATFLRDVARIPIANQHYRLAELQRNLERAGKNIVLRNQIIEQAAKEVGGLYTNKRNLTINPREGLAALIGCSPDELPPNSDSHA